MIHEAGPLPFPIHGTQTRSTNQQNIFTLTHTNEARKKLWGGMMSIVNVSLKFAGV